MESDARLVRATIPTPPEPDYSPSVPDPDYVTKPVTPPPPSTEDDDPRSGTDGIAA